MKLDTAIEEVQTAETELAKHLRLVGERHATEHDLYHLGHTLATQCEEHLVQLAPFTERYGATPADAGLTESAGLVESFRHRSAELLGRGESSGLFLLRDLKSLFVTAQEAEIAWVILGQAAKAVRDEELIGLVEGCHEEAEHLVLWARTRIKVTAPEVLATG